MTVAKTPSGGEMYWPPLHLPPKDPRSLLVLG
ncbi:unnamed protein product [Linum tenue]|uniref:Uncharacterized protein n=1 Tax=Linum tenue TaxID=586396 RepID=A0AAV0NKK4_9ROSI|nr:unnamed protein product [Linum tenue]